MSVLSKRSILLSDWSASIASVSSTPLLDVRVLLSEVMGLPVAEIFSPVALTHAQYCQMQAMVHRRMQSEPVAYILGHCEFWGLSLDIHRGVLIPRPDTECLVEAVLSRHHDMPQRCLDLGVGSGAIALALAYERPSWLIDGVDRSPTASACAKKNAIRHGLEHRVRVHQADWACYATDHAELAYDLVVSNPPYIARESPYVCTETACYEPEEALYASDSGLSDLLNISRMGCRFLRKGGWLFLEHGFDQGASLRAFLGHLGYTHIATKSDYAGHERVTFACWSSPL